MHITFSKLVFFNHICIAKTGCLIKKSLKEGCCTLTTTSSPSLIRLDSFTGSICWKHLQPSLMFYRNLLQNKSGLEPVVRLCWHPRWTFSCVFVPELSSLHELSWGQGGLAEGWAPAEHWLSPNIGCSGDSHTSSAQLENGTAGKHMEHRNTWKNCCQVRGDVTHSPGILPAWGGVTEATSALGVLHPITLQAKIRASPW